MKNLPTIIRQPGFDYGFDPGACSACGGGCCRGKAGRVWIGEQDVRNIGEFLDLNRVDFILRFTHRTDNRLSLRELYGDDGYACVFFDTTGKKCTIYPVRPEQCRRFPFWEYFRTCREELAGECPGVRWDAPDEARSR